MIFLIFYFIKCETSGSFVNHFDGHFAYLKTLDLTSNNHAVWQGLQQITRYKQKPTPANNDRTLPNQLNHFYSRFDKKNTTKT